MKTHNSLEHNIRTTAAKSQS